MNAETGAIIDVNPFLIELLGYSRKEFIKKKLWEVGAFKDVESSKSAFQALQKNEYIRYKDLPLRARDGKLIAVEFVSNVYPEGDHKVIQCNIRNITERKQVQDDLLKNEAYLYEQSVRDHLTGLFNRRYMEETLERELRRASRRQLSLGIIMLDVDDFKSYNDTYGHVAGDAILRELGSLLLGHVRGEDIACRYGGDEFIIVLPDVSRDVASQRAELIRQQVHNFNIHFQEQILGSIMLSLGVAVSPEHGSSSAALLKAVDDALYRAKRAGRDLVVVAE